MTLQQRNEKRLPAGEEQKELREKIFYLDFTSGRILPFIDFFFANEIPFSKKEKNFQRKMIRLKRKLIRMCGDYFEVIE